MSPASASKSRLLASTRLSVSIMCCLLLFELMLLRVNISMALVCMVKSPSRLSSVVTANYSSFNTSVHGAAAAVPDAVVNRNCSGTHNETDIGRCTRSEGEFDWSKNIQGMILSSYFFGYITTQAVGGWLGGRYGAKHVAGTGLLVSVVTTVVQPAAARLSPYLIACLRVLLGVASGILFSNVHNLLGRWAPPLERTFLNSIVSMGFPLGAMTALLVSSQFCALPVDNGWPFAFYITGSVGFLVWICWNIIIYSSPSEHPRISPQELEYIARCTGTNTTAEQQRRRSFPWLKALTSPAVLAIMGAQTSITWLFYTNIMTFPMYMKDVLKFDIKQNGLLLMLPPGVMMFVNPALGQIVDIVRRRRIFSTTVVRKIVQGISHYTSVALLIALSFVDHDTRYVAVVIFVVLSIIQGLNWSGAQVNIQDIAPRYSGEIFGIVNTVATLSGVFAPMICGLLTPNGSAAEWRVVFLIAAGILAVGGCIFSMFARGEVVDWAKDEQHDVDVTSSCFIKDATVPVLTDDTGLNCLHKDNKLDDSRT